MSDTIDPSDPNVQNPNSYNEFAKLVNEITDLEVLDAAEGLMNDLATMNNMRQRLEMMEKELHAGKRAVFYFFTLSLSEDEISGAAQTVKGRKRMVTEKLKKAAELAAKEAEENEVAEGEISEE
jgi:hypothetical protein